MKNENIYYEYDNSEVQQMKEQGMILEKDNNDEKLGGRSR